MGFPAYPQYQDSQTDWLGKVPANWEVRRLKFSTCLINEKSNAQEATLDYLGLEHIESWTGKRITDHTSTSEGISSKFAPGDVLFGKLRPYLAKVWLADSQGVATSEALVIRPDNEVIGCFLKYYMLSRDFIDVVNGSTYGSKMPRANWDFIGNLSLLIPAIKEQRQIARFLDHKTAQIDRLIEKKQELIEKLQEQRIAIITQAVTKGLVPEALMQNTKINWLGAIPSTWEISPLKRIINEDTRNGLYKEKDQFIADGIPFVQMGEAFAEPELTQTARDRVNTTQGELHKWGLLEGDLLFARRSLVFEGSGKCVIIGKLQEPHLFESSMIRVRIDTQKALPKFIFHYFQSAFSRAEILATTKTVTISGIDSQQLKGLTVCLPDIKTQGEIVDFISKSSEKFSAAITANSTTIARLMEYRTALITAAVTGQIDVRNWQAPDVSKQSAQDKEVA